jgi:four helix bundle protein
MNNIAEGFGRNGNKEFIRFLDFAQSSCMEVKSITYVLEDVKYLPEEAIQLIRQKI